MQAVQEALQAGDIGPEQADAARDRYAAIHRHFVQAMAKEKQLLDEAKQLNEDLLVSNKAANIRFAFALGRLLLMAGVAALRDCPYASLLPVVFLCFIITPRNPCLYRNNDKRLR